MEFEKLQTIISTVLNLDPQGIRPETRFIEDLGADSLDVFQIVMGIEEEFDIEISTEMTGNIFCVQDAVKAIKTAI